MDIEHSGLLSWVHERKGCPEKQKPCARLRDAALDARSASGDPAMVFEFRMASILSCSHGHLPVTPSGRIAAGRCRFEHDPSEKLVSAFFGSCSCAGSFSKKSAKSDFERPCKKRARTGARTPTSS